MGRKKEKSKRGCLIPLLFLLFLLAALFYFSTGGGGGGGGAPSEPIGVSVSPRVEKLRDSLRGTAKKIRAALSPASKAAPKRNPVPPVPPDQLAAWSGAHPSGTAADSAPDSALPGEMALPLDADDVGAPASSVSSRNTPAGFPGVIFLRYKPPSREAGFSAILAPAGLDPVSVEGYTTKEFAENLLRRLDELAESTKEEYTRFYALETDNAGPSQTRWLLESVKERFPGILCETESSTMSLNHDPDQE